MIEEVVEKYLRKFPDERAKLKTLLGQLKAGEDLANRRNFRGHIAGCGVIFSPGRAKILLIEHPVFGWQQPGGHMDPGEDGPWLTGERESIEETGVRLAEKINYGDERVPLLIETHTVPYHEQKNEAEHFHHGFYYGFIAASEELTMGDEVIKEAKWVKIDEVDSTPALHEAIARAQKLLKLTPSEIGNQR